MCGCVIILSMTVSMHGGGGSGDATTALTTATDLTVTLTCSGKQTTSEKRLDSQKPIHRKRRTRNGPNHVLHAPGRGTPFLTHARAATQTTTPTRRGNGVDTYHTPRVSLVTLVTKRKTNTFDFGVLFNGSRAQGLKGVNY